MNLNAAIERARESREIKKLGCRTLAQNACLNGESGRVRKPLAIRAIRVIRGLDCSV